MLCTQGLHVSTAAAVDFGIGSHHWTDTCIWFLAEQGVQPSCLVSQWSDPAPLCTFRLGWLSPSTDVPSFNGTVWSVLHSTSQMGLSSLPLELNMSRLQHSPCVGTAVRAIPNYVARLASFCLGSCSQPAVQSKTTRTGGIPWIQLVSLPASWQMSYTGYSGAWN